MSDAIAVHHGTYGRCGLYNLNRSLPNHANLESHLIFFLNGETGYSTVDGRVYPMNEDTIVAVNPLQPHAGEYGRHGGESCVVALYIKPEWLMEMGDGSGPLRFESNVLRSTDEIRQLLDQVNQLIREPGTQELLHPLIYRLTRACLIASARAADHPCANKAPDSATRFTDPRIRKSLALIHEYLKDDVPPEHIAREVGLSRPHFYKLFREHVGVTPSVYQNALKIDVAIERLTGSDMPVNSIGHELGFASPASFSRFFTANVGIPPVTYRRVSSVERESAIA
jgi:AraC-like DNA-binding protein